MFLSCIERQLDSGLRLIQLRTQSLSGNKLKELALDIRTQCQAHDATLYINEDIALAKSLDCPGHLKSRQLMQADIECQLAGHSFSASCHTIDDLSKAEELAATFVTLGPVRETKTHPEQKGIGWNTFEKLRNEVSLPIFALGGLVAEDLSLARKHGAQGIAGITGFWPVTL